MRMLKIFKAEEPRATHVLSELIAPEADKWIQQTMEAIGRILDRKDLTRSEQECELLELVVREKLEGRR